MVNKDTLIATVRQVLTSGFMVIALVLTLIGSSATMSAPFVNDSPPRLTGAIAQDDVATLSSAWKATRSHEHRSGQDPDEFAVPVGLAALLERTPTGDETRTPAILRVRNSTGLPQSRAPPLT